MNVLVDNSHNVIRDPLLSFAQPGNYGGINSTTYTAQPRYRSKWHSPRHFRAGFSRMVKDFIVPKFLARNTNNSSNNKPSGQNSAVTGRQAVRHHWDFDTLVPGKEEADDPAQAARKSSESVSSTRQIKRSKPSDDSKRSSRVFEQSPLLTKSDVAGLTSRTSPEMRTRSAGSSRHATPIEGDFELYHQEQIEYISFKKRQIIENLLAMLEEWLENNREQLRRRGDGNGAGRNGAGITSQSGSTPKRHAGQKRSRGGGSQDGSSPPGGDGGNDEEKRGHKRSKKDDLKRQQRRLACPFFKNDQAAHSDKSACTGPGFLTIARLKEHLYRCHVAAPFRCVRCCEEFTEFEEHEKHQLLEVACTVVQDRPAPEGLSDAQVRELKRKSPCGKSDAEKWKEIYRIIFGEDSVIPTPYYDRESSEPADVEAEIFSLVREEIDKRFDVFEEGQQAVLVDIVRRVVRKVTAKDGRKASVSESDSRSLPEDPLAEGLDFDLNQFLLDPTLSGLPQGDPDYLQFQSCPGGGDNYLIAGATDSGYGSSSPRSFKD